jgi:hypothetical protein
LQQFQGILYIFLTNLPLSFYCYYKCSFKLSSRKTVE